MQKIKLYNAHCCGEIGDVVIGLEKINYNSPAVDQKRRQTTWIEVHQWLLKPELSMERPLLVIVPAFQSILDRSPQK